MKVLPRVQSVTPVESLKKSIQKSVHHEGQERLQTRRELLNETVLQLAVTERQQPDSGDSDPDPNAQKQDHSSVGHEAVRANLGNPQAPLTGEEALPLNINRLGGLIAAFVVHSVVHGSWAVQIPLSHELLQETVLHMRCEQSVLTLRFETPEWESRNTLMRYAPALLGRLRQSLPHLADVMLLTDS